MIIMKKLYEIIERAFTLAEKSIPSQRERIAVAIMNGRLASGNIPEDDLVKESVIMADSMINHLKYLKR